MRFRIKLAALMRKWSDRLDSDGAPKLTGWSFTHEKYVGTVFREDGRGCPVAYLGERALYRASDEDGSLPAVYWRRTTNWLSPELKLTAERIPGCEGDILPPDQFLAPPMEYSGRPPSWMKIGGTGDGSETVIHESPEKPWDHS